MFKTALTAAALTLAFTFTAAAQQPTPATQGTQNIKRTPLQKFDVPGSNYEVVIGLAEIAPGVDSIGKHTHPGIEAGYLIEGGSVLTIDGGQKIELKPGSSYQIPAGAAHDAGVGAQGGKIIAVYVVEKGKPLASPVK